MKKILFSAWGGNGGVDDVVKSLQEGLAQRNVDSELIIHPRDYSDPNGPVSTELFEKGKTQWYGSFGEFVASRDWSQYAAVDLHSCNFTDTEISALENAAEHAPVLYHGHGIIPHVAYVEYIDSNTSDSRAYLEWLNSLSELDRTKIIRDEFTQWPVCKHQEVLFNRAEKLVFLTGFTRDRFRFFYPAASSGNYREVIIPNGSDIGKYANSYDVDRRAANIREGIGRDCNIIMFSGRITPPKGASDLAKAFDRIRELYPAKLMLVGEAHEDYGGLNCVYDHIRPEFRGDVVATGWVCDKKELAAHYKAADVLVIPSYHETFSVSALEGMFMGTPVIIGDVDGSHEVYVEPQLAYGTKPGDVDRMCDLFYYLFEDPDRASQNAAHVQKVVNDRYTLDNVVDTTLGFYTAAIMERGGRLVNKYTAQGNMPKAREMHRRIRESLSF